MRENRPGVVITAIGLLMNLAGRGLHTLVEGGSDRSMTLLALLLDFVGAVLVVFGLVRLTLWEIQTKKQAKQGTPPSSEDTPPAGSPATVTEDKTQQAGRR